MILLVKNRIFITLILAAAIPFGANVLWAQQFMTIAVAIIGLVHFSDDASQQRAPISSIKLPIILYLTALVWVVVQVLPWVPVSWLHPLYSITKAAVNQDTQAFISLWPDATQTGLLNHLTYGLVFLISYQIHASTHQVIKTLKTVLLAGTAYAFYGLLNFFQSPNLILWFECQAYCDIVHSTFINRNSYATFAGLTLLAGLPALLQGIQGANRYGLTTPFGRQYFVEKFLISQWQTLLWMSVITTALLLTESRGGFLATSLALVMFFVVLQLTHKIKGHGFVFFALVILMSLLVFDRSGDGVVDRIDGIDMLNNDRLVVYGLVETANDQNPWLGLGLESFEKTFRLFRDESIVSYFDKAHNTYLELIFEIGYIPAVLLCISIVFIAGICIKGVWVRQRDWVYPAIGLSAILLVASHALVDFSLQIPAVSYLFALMMGVSVAQSFSRSAKNQHMNQNSRSKIVQFRPE